MFLKGALRRLAGHVLLHPHVSGRSACPLYSAYIRWWVGMFSVLPLDVCVERGHCSASQDFCVLFLSMEIHIINDIPSTKVPSSFHARDPRIPAPFAELPFDTHIHVDPLHPGRTTLNSLGSLEFTAKFGRPLSVRSNIALLTN